MSVIDQKAAEAASAMTKNDSTVPGAVAFDPFTLLMIAGLIVDIIKMFQQCRQSSNDAVRRMQNPGLFDRWTMRRLVRRHTASASKVYAQRGPISLPSEACSMWAPNSTVQVQKVTEDALRSVAATLTESDVDEMYKEAASNPAPAPSMRYPDDE